MANRTIEGGAPVADPTAGLLAPPTEPDDVAEYSKETYWSRRYATEPSYDWFASVYPACLAMCVAAVKERRALLLQNGERRPVRVLHLGCGNSALCADIDDALGSEEGCDAREPSVLQLAVDYSSVVIDAMASRHRDRRNLRWLCADVRALPDTLLALDTATEGQQPPRTDGSEAALRVCGFHPPFDIIVDKGTMDALQADKESETLEDDIDRMLQGVSALLIPEGGAFYQFTWETPYFRKHWTMQSEKDYAWCRETSNDEQGAALATDANEKRAARGVTHGPIGESDVYYWLRHRT